MHNAAHRSLEAGLRTMTFAQLISTASSKGASDIHLRAGHAPLVRVHGELQRWTSVAP